ncbi:Serine/arginine-rich splicing factor RSZ21A [Zea mays]|uniref:Serine/arginine-rich splicing factor RSZ21A n=1 Tax=Zea mays TaxID=4577 RepID=A0A3L6D9Y8_MAIZE|nr:Serine/arginine-rich splicing factor RSZ21A [Zea mays]
MARLYIGNLDPRVTARELEDEFRTFGVLRSVWVARKPPGFAFIDFDDKRDAEDAIRDLDGKNGWRVELSRNASGGRGGRDRHGGSESKCYECGETGHFARVTVLQHALQGVVASHQLVDAAIADTVAAGARARSLYLTSVM